MRGLRKALASAACLGLALMPIAAFGQAEDAPADMTGNVNVGDEAPGFTLTGHDGKEYTLSDLTEKGRVALVFYRSANW